VDLLSVSAFLILWSFGFLLLWHLDVAPLPTGSDPAPHVSAIIPARNEAANLGELLRSLHQQSQPLAEILVVDDNSTDETAQIAHAAGARVVEAASLPAGWCGKPWACWQGAQHASGDLLLFLDADTRLMPDGLQRLIAVHAAGGGLVSVQPFHRMTHPYEQLSAFFNLISLASLGAYGLFRGHRSPAGAFGPCNVCSRDDYFAVGGHQRAAGAVVESLPLGQAFLDVGLDLRCLGGKGAVWFRMYPDGPGALMNGFGKSFALGARHLSVATGLLVTGWLVAGFEPIRHLIQEATAGNAAGFALWSICYLLFAAQLHWMLVQIGNFRRTTALAYPVPLLFFLGVFVRSVLAARITGKVRWKDRVIGT